MPSLECDCFLRSCSALRVHRSPGAIYTLYRLPPPAAVSAGAVVGVDKRKWVWREEGWPGWTVWTVVRRLRQYWKVTMAAPSYTNICLQSAAWPVNRSEYQNINLSPSYGREREGGREGELATLYSQFMPAANIMREQPEKLELSSLIIVFYWGCIWMISMI